MKCQVTVTALKVNSPAGSKDNRQEIEAVHNKHKKMYGNKPSTLFYLHESVKLHISILMVKGH